MADLTQMYDAANQLKEEGKFDEAIAALNSLLEEAPDYVLAHMALAVLLGKQDQHEQAVQHAVRACEIEPDQAFNFTALSVTYQRAFAGTQNQDYIRLAEEAMAQARALSM
jgi:tetratricopeptide (TPR) repeat protein